MPKDDLLNFAIKIAQKAGKFIVKEAAKGFSVKSKSSPRDLVTSIDVATEKLIIEEIKKKFPDHSILAEEGVSKELDYTDSPYVWIIDPLDGTLNFTHQLPFYSVSIAVFKVDEMDKSQNYEYLSGEIVAGVVFAPKLDQIFYAEKDGGAYMNGKKILASKVETLDKCLTATGFPPKNKELNMPYFELMTEKAQGVRRLGSAALDLCLVAAGQLDVFWEFGLKPWDIAAGSLIASEAGATVTDTNGELLDLFGQDILATNGLVHDEVIDEFSQLA